MQTNEKFHVSKSDKQFNFYKFNLDHFNILLKCRESWNYVYICIISVCNVSSDSDSLFTVNLKLPEFHHD